ncbi:unnamed protein product [Allacma fusca]|uniref:Uncharacterized protein n=1 Tax=Allacma fusca TaxID=39272 RepID=A0A8J2KEU2_9HEXA|nr:unnamed protein product [Allacma fusca]
MWIPYALSDPRDVNIRLMKPLVPVKLTHVTCLLTIVIVSLKNIEFEKTNLMKIHTAYRHQPPIMTFTGSVEFTMQFLVFLVPESPNNKKTVSQLNQTSGLSANASISLMPSTFAHGFFFCSSCSRDDYDLIEFECSMESLYRDMLVARETLTKNGTNILWITAKPSGDADVLLDNRTPFYRKSPARLRVSTLKFLLSGNNSTLMGNYDKILERDQDPKNYIWGAGKPRILWQLDWNTMQMPDNLYFYITGSTSTFKFITSDGITRKSDETFQRFIIPFQPSFWYFLLGTLILTAFFMTIILYKMQPNVSLPRKFMGTLAKLLYVLLEQDADYNEMTVMAARFSKGALITWLVAAIVITNAYKGVVNSNFVFSFPYETKWRTLMDLSNFKLYLPTKNESVCSSHRSLQYTTRSLVGVQKNMKFEPHEFFNQLNRRYTMSVLERYDDEPKWQRTHNILQYTMDRIYFFCDQTQTLAYIIKKELREPKTAMVVETKQFPIYWRQVRDLVRANRKLKFAHNYKITDNFLKMPSGYYLTGGMDQVYQLVPNRLKILMSSGIYWLWEKWDKIIFPDYESEAGRDDGGNTEFLESNTATVRPLILRDPDIYLNFQLYSFCLILSVAILLVECIHSYGKSKQIFGRVFDRFRRNFSGVKIYVGPN